MKPPRVQFTLRRMFILVMIVALLLTTGRWAYHRYAGPVVTKVYYVGDLVRPDGDIGTPATMTELSDQATLLKSSITPEVWWLPTRAVTPAPSAFSLIVRHNQVGHEYVKSWLRQRRDRLAASNP